jgi:coenzyme F420-reducing hydrogenase alpha subunit
MSDADDAERRLAKAIRDLLAPSLCTDRKVAHLEETANRFAELHEQDYRSDATMAATQAMIWETVALGGVVSELIPQTVVDVCIEIVTESLAQIQAREDMTDQEKEDGGLALRNYLHSLSHIKAFHAAFAKMHNVYYPTTETS